MDRPKQVKLTASQPLQAAADADSAKAQSAMPSCNDGRKMLRPPPEGRTAAEAQFYLMLNREIKIGDPLYELLGQVAALEEQAALPSLESMPADHLAIGGLPSTLSNRP